MKNNDRHMALPTDLTLPEGIVPVDDLLRADPSDGRPIVLVTAGESETALEIPAGADLTLIEFFEKNADARTEISLGPDARFHHLPHHSGRRKHPLSFHPRTGRKFPKQFRDRLSPGHAHLALRTGLAPRG